MIPVLYWSNNSSFTQGGQRSLSYILRDIDRSKYLPVLACREEGELTVMARELGIAVELMKLPLAMRPRYLLDIIKFISALLKVIDRHGAKIVHSEELTVVFMAFFLKPLRGIKTIWHVRVLWDNPFQKIIGLILSDAVVCVSNAVKDSFRSASKKLVVIHNGINPDEFLPQGEKAASGRFTDKDVLVGQVGTLVEHKKTDIFVSAASIVFKMHPSVNPVRDTSTGLPDKNDDNRVSPIISCQTVESSADKGRPISNGVKFLVIGSGAEDYVSRLKNLARDLGVEKNVIFWGEEKNIKPLLNRLDVVCLLSKNEGLSRTLLEAMSLEKAIVVSNIPQNMELITHGKTGLTAKLDSPEDTALQIKTLLSDRAYASSLGKAARQFVSENFSLNKTISLIHNLYGSLESK